MHASMKKIVDDGRHSIWVSLIIQVVLCVDVGVERVLWGFVVVE